jgi:hypothetical protein
VSSSLRLLFEEMENGIDHDFKSRAPLVKQSLNQIQDIENQLFEQDEVKELIASALHDILYKREVMKHPSAKDLKPLSETAQRLIQTLD